MLVKQETIASSVIVILENWTRLTRHISTTQPMNMISMSDRLGGWLTTVWMVKFKTQNQIKF